MEGDIEFLDKIENKFDPLQSYFEKNEKVSGSKRQKL